ncbi:hypothetical protein PAPYR_11396 [Paratrimastix pyriformis]|uniref:Uncharacterized protein n=1 Tax=Paratrimastix pyriformis TaxID=342808 RepID=A0ABQ8U9I6_9EUKA|nr:hypothetical protein PAPYR_11396 [Paratrimastix pyriformis]
MLVVSLLAMSQTLRSHSSTCDSEIRTITGHARNSFRAQVLLKPVFHLGLIDLVAREGEYSERSESLLNNRPVVLWVCTWHLHVALFIPWPFFVPEGKPPTSNLSLRQNLPKPKIVSVLNSHVGSSVARASMLKGASAPLRPCTSGSRCGVLRADWGLPAPLQNVSVGSTNARPRPLHPIDETDTLAAVPFGTPLGAREERPRAPTYTFQSLPITPAHPIPTSEGHDGAAPSREGEHPCKAENSALVRLAHSRVALFHSISASLLGALRCCLRLPMTITPTLGPLCDFSAYLLVYVPAPRAIRGMFGCGARGYTNTGKNWCYALEGLAPCSCPGHLFDAIISTTSVVTFRAGLCAHHALECVLTAA